MGERYWDRDQQITGKQWHAVSLLGYSFSSNIALKEHHYKVQQRGTGLLQESLKCSPPASRWRCKENRATYRHVWWEYSKVRSCFKSLSIDMENIVGCRLPFSMRTICFMIFLHCR